MTYQHPGPGEERLEDGEDAIIAEILEYNRDLMVARDGTLKRAQHPKHHGCAIATFTVRDGLPPGMNVGLFARPATYHALIRFSNGLRQDDRQPDAHGMAIKILDVPGDRLDPDPQHPGSFDVILIDHPVMFAQDLAQYRAANELIHDKIEINRSDSNWLFKKIAGAWETAEALIEGGRKLLGRIKAFASQRPRSPLTSNYWSTTPYRLGNGQAVKYMAQPVGAQDPEGLAEDRDILADALVEGLENGPARFVFGVHLQRDPVAHPVENATVRWWSEDEDPGGVDTMVPLADIAITALDADAVAERIAFNPWNVLPDHRPLGGINRVRRAVYGELQRERRSDGAAGGV